MTSPLTLPILINHLQERFTCLASTDVAGLFGNFLEAHALWNMALSEVLDREARLPIGLEVLAFRPLFLRPDYLKLLQANLNNIGGFHGRPGLHRNWIENFGVNVAHYAMVPSVKLITRLENFFSDATYYAYVNFHDVEFDSLTAISSTSHLLVVKENVPNYKSGISPRIFDIVHNLLNYSGKDLSKLVNGWSQMLLDFAKIGQAIVHVPIGTNIGDSLPTAKITPTMWSELVSLIKSTGSFVTLECQFSHRDKLFCQPSRRPDLKLHVEHQLEILLKNRVIEVK